MIKRLVFALCLLWPLVASAQVGQIPTFVTPTPSATCSNQLDLSQACNSQYIFAVVK